MRTPGAQLRTQPWRQLFFLCSLLLSLFGIHGAEFAVYDIYLEPGGQPLAAYQIKIWDKRAAIKIISVEGGDHAAFQKAPFFDPKAIQRDVIKLAAFHAGQGGGLPTRRVRVASLHVQIGPNLKPDLAVAIEAAAGPGGRKMVPQAVVTRRITE